MSDDISKKTVVILVVITVLVSFVGTFIVLNNLNDVQANNQDVLGQNEIASGNGAITLNIERQEKAEGSIMLEILPNPKRIENN